MRLGRMRIERDLGFRVPRDALHHGRRTDPLANPGEAGRTPQGAARRPPVHRDRGSNERGLPGRWTRQGARPAACPRACRSGGGSPRYRAGARRRVPPVRPSGSPDGRLRDCRHGPPPRRSCCDERPTLLEGQGSSHDLDLGRKRDDMAFPHERQSVLGDMLGWLQFYSHCHKSGSLIVARPGIGSGRSVDVALDLSNASDIVEVCLGKPESRRLGGRRPRQSSSVSRPITRRTSKRCSRPRRSRSGTTSRAGVGSSRRVSSARWAGVNSEVGSRITSFTLSPRITRPMRSTTATLGSGRSSRKQSGSSRKPRWSGSATQSLNFEVESDDTPGVSMIVSRPTLYRDAALADPTGPSLRKEVSVLVDAGHVVWIRPSTDEGALPPDVHIIDAGGSTIVPGMVDAHSHVTLPGGSHWIDRGADPPEELLEVAEHNGDLLSRAGVRWARDVASPLAVDPRDGRRRALALRVRERWHADPNRPRIRVAGTWISHSGVITGGLLIEADDGPALLKAASTQLDDGAAFLKLYLDGPKKGEAPWSTEDVQAVVELAHGRGAKVTAHSGFLVGARVGIDAGVDSLEHGFELDSDAVATRARQGTFLVSTLAIFRSWATLGQTTTLPRFIGDEGKGRIVRRRERAIESVQLAQRAEVRIATGTDFGGGSLRANHLAWEVESLVEAGLKPSEALTSATVRGGELLREPEAGRLVEGGPADFFLVHGDPLTDLTALWRVWRVAWLPEAPGRAEPTRR